MTRPRPAAATVASPSRAVPTGRARALARVAALGGLALTAGLLGLPGDGEPGGPADVVAPAPDDVSAPARHGAVVARTGEDALAEVARAAGLDRGVTRATDGTGGGDAVSSTAFRLPVPGGALRARFDPPAQRWSAGHRGVDLEAATGTVVSAPAPGTVVFAGPVVDRHVVTVLHDDGLRSSLEPVLAVVEVGTRVAAGEALGTVEPAPAATHCSPRCLHWGVRDGELYVDPLGLVAGTGPVVLLPGPPDR